MCQWQLFLRCLFVTTIRYNGKRSPLSIEHNRYYDQFLFIAIVATTISASHHVNSFLCFYSVREKKTFFFAVAQKKVSIRKLRRNFDSQFIRNCVGNASTSIWNSECAKGQSIWSLFSFLIMLTEGKVNKTGKYALISCLGRQKKKYLKIIAICQSERGHINETKFCFRAVYSTEKKTSLIISTVSHSAWDEINIHTTDTAVRFAVLDELWSHKIITYSVWGRVSQFFCQLGYKETSNQLLNLIRVRDKISTKKKNACETVRSWTKRAERKRTRQKKVASRLENVFEGCNTQK